MFIKCCVIIKSKDYMKEIEKAADGLNISRSSLDSLTCNFHSLQLPPEITDASTLLEEHQIRCCYAREDHYGLQMQCPLYIY